MSKHNTLLFSIQPEPHEVIDCLFFFLFACFCFVFLFFLNLEDWTVSDKEIPQISVLVMFSPEKFDKNKQGEPRV